MIKRLEILLKERKAITVSGKRCAYIKMIENSDDGIHADAVVIEADCCENIGSRHSLVTIRYGNKGFTFKPIEVKRGGPMYYAEEGVIIREEGDVYDFTNIGDVLIGEEKKKQATYSEALKATGGIQSCPTVLGIPGDIRTFELGFRKYPIEEKQHMELYDYIVPHYNWSKAPLVETGSDGITYRYLLGRGVGCKTRIKRRLKDGCLPVLTSRIVDDDVEYTLNAFVTLYDRTPDKAEGTPYLLADKYSAASVFSKEQEAQIEKLGFASKSPVLMARVEVCNRSVVPKLAFVRLPHINTFVMAEKTVVEGQRYDGEQGYGKIKDKVYLVAKLNGRACSDLETSVLLGGSQKCVYEWILFHSPVEESDAARYDPAEFERILQREEKFYKRALKNIAQITVPEKRINEIWKADYLQMAQNCFGAAEEDALAPAVGVYCAIASESENVVSSLASCGDFERAKRCANYFFRKQRADGFIQDMKNYMLETGGTLYLAGAVWNYTRDKDWLKGIEKGIMKAYGYISRWIARNSARDGRNGCGLIDGQVADPEDNYRLYMLNALTYCGLKRAAQMLEALGNDSADTVRKSAERLRSDILASLEHNLITAPLSPMKDGTFAPLLPAWAEADGAVCLHLDGEIATTHASVVLKDSLLSVPALIKYEVIAPDSQIADIIVKSQKSVFLQNCVGLSEPYYSSLPFADLRRGNVDDYIEEFYYALASLSDRETYTFWEHYFLATPHKTSEQGAFHCRLRQIFAYEDFENNMLIALRGLPDCWKNAKDNHIEVKRLATMLGELSVDYKNTEEKRYELNVDFKPFDEKTRLRLYLPVRSGEKNGTEFIDITGGRRKIQWTTK